MFRCRFVVGLIVGGMVICSVRLLPAAAPLAERHFELSCFASVSNIPAGTRRVDLWMPIPASDPQQAIEDLQIDSSFPHEIQTEREYGNRVLHVWSDSPSRLTATVQFTCTRRGERALEATGGISDGPAPSPRLLQPDRLGVINDRVRSLAARITSGASDPLAKARAIYDYVVGHMDYDKTVPGWGNGDTLRACAVGKGNCTDFHALFISLARASGIPARFGIGFQLPPEPAQGDVQGYHCWAELWVPQRGWVPVDCSEAQKHSGERTFYFGSLDANRVRMSIGRDLVLPGMRGQPLNYFVFPYGEADGKPVVVEHHVTLKPAPVR